jgi:hypothetical protein
VTAEEEKQMKKKTGANVLRTTAVLVSVVVFLGGCDLFQVGVGDSPGSGGGVGAPATLSISIADGRISGSGFEPGVGQTVVRYAVSGTGPDGASFGPTSVDVASPSLTVADLVAGEWTIVVNAYNASDIRIGTGTTTTTLSPGASTPASITVSDLPDPGTLDLKVDWPAAAMVTSFSATVTPTDGSGTPADDDAVNLSVDGPIRDSRDWSALSQLDPGFYQLVLTVEYGDRASSILGPEVVRIASSATTVALVTITTANLEDGSLVVEIVDETLGSTPFSVSVTGDGDGTATAAISDDDVGASYSYRWFVEGVLVEEVGEGAGTEELNLSGRDPGRYNVSVIVSDGTHLDSDSTVVTVPATPEA